MLTLYHQVWIDAPLEKIYQALATAEGLGQWWAPHTTTPTKAGLVLSHNPGERHGEVKMRVLDLTPNQRVEWEIISTHPKHSPASAWTGTRISFELYEKQNPREWLGITSDNPLLTVLDFRHSSWDEHNEFLGFCNFAWGETLLLLKQWCETH